MSDVEVEITDDAVYIDLRGDYLKFTYEQAAYIRSQLEGASL